MQLREVRAPRLGPRLEDGPGELLQVAVRIRGRASVRVCCNVTMGKYIDKSVLNEPVLADSGAGSGAGVRGASEGGQGGNCGVGSSSGIRGSRTHAPGRHPHGG